MEKENEIEGIFYTKRDKAIKGTAYTYGKFWAVTNHKGKEFTRSTLFLDRRRKVPAPKTITERENFAEEVRKIIAKYENKLKSYEGHEEYKRVSGSYEMGVKLAKSYIIEYKRIYAGHFRSNAIQFILDDWVYED